MEETFNPNERTLTAPRVLEHIKDNGGCTLLISGDIPTLEIVDFTARGKAYAVAIFHGDDLRISNYLLCDDNLLHMIIRAFTRWVQYQSPSAYFGAWVDVDDLVLDASEVLHDIDDAIEVAERFDQAAVYDLINHEVIPCLDHFLSQGGDE